MDTTFGQLTRDELTALRDTIHAAWRSLYDAYDTSASRAIREDMASLLWEVGRASAGVPVSRRTIAGIWA